MILRRFIFFITTILVLSTHTAFANPKVEFETTLGNFTVELDPQAAPISSANFLKYVDSGYYNGTLFHRVIDGFMVQGGGFDQNMEEKTTRASIKLESQNGLKNSRGTIAMARTAIPDSATSQFFINVVDNQSLDHPSPDGYGYAVFGKVIHGMDTIDKIRVAPTTSRGMFQNVPASPIVIKSAKQISS